MNLYIKNLEPHITNQDLTQIFGKFGRIISARVMTNPQTGQSKGYGFVSFGNSEEAALALQEMNGQMLGNRPLTVAYHEPRKGSVSSGGARGAGGNQQQQQQQQDYSQQQSYYNSNNNSNAYNQNNNHNSYNQQQQRSNYSK
jgi:RNA recognition motif-containing protein